MAESVDTTILANDEQAAKSYVQSRLQKVFDGKNLSRDEARNCMLLFLNKKLGESSRPTFAALFSAIMARDDPTVEEVLGFFDVVKWHDQNHRYVPDVDGTIGIVGSGKDDLKTFNVSTAASIVASACGAPVVKNGSRSESGVSGTTDVMEYLGIEIAPNDETVSMSLDACNLTFADAAKCFPRMGDMYIGSFIFVNPLSYILSIASSIEFNHIVFGLSNPNLKFTGQLLCELGYTESYVVNGSDPAGNQIDELSVVGPSRLLYVTGAEEFRERSFSPSDVGIDRHPPEEIQEGSTLTENARILVNAISGAQAERGRPTTDMVALNTAPVLVTAGEATDLIDGVERAYHAIESGAAEETIYELADVAGSGTAQLTETISELQE